MKRSLEDQKQQLISGLISARSRIMQAAQAFSEPQQDRGFLGTWSIKDMLAHLMGWDFTNIQAIQQILAGIPPEFFNYFDKDWQSYNATLVARHRVEPYAALLEAVHESHHKFIDFLNSIPAETLVNGKVKRDNGRTVTIRNLIKAETRDEQKHADQVQAFLEGELTTPG